MVIECLVSIKLPSKNNWSENELIASYIKALPEEINPLNLRDPLEPNLPTQRHGKAWINLVQQVLLHSGNIHHSHQLSLPAG